DGLYASFGLVLSYMAIGALIATIGWTGSIVLAGCFLLSLLFRLYFMNDVPAPVLAIPVWCVGAVISIGLSVAMIARSNMIKAAALCLAAVPTLLITHPFGSARLVYAAHNVIRQVAGNGLPIILWNTADPLNSVNSSIVASFTEKAWTLQSSDFPN